MSARSPSRPGRWCSARSRPPTWRAGRVSTSRGSWWSRTGARNGTETSRSRSSVPPTCLWRTASRPFRGRSICPWCRPRQSGPGRKGAATASWWSIRRARRWCREAPVTSKGVSTASRRTSCISGSAASASPARTTPGCISRRSSGPPEPAARARCTGTTSTGRSARSHSPRVAGTRRRASPGVREFAAAGDPPVGLATLPFGQAVDAFTGCG